MPTTEAAGHPFIRDVWHPGMAPADPYAAQPVPVTWAARDPLPGAEGARTINFTPFHDADWQTQMLQRRYPPPPPLLYGPHPPPGPSAAGQ